MNAYDVDDDYDDAGGDEDQDDGYDEEDDDDESDLTSGPVELNDDGTVSYWSSLDQGWVDGAERVDEEDLEQMEENEDRWLVEEHLSGDDAGDDM